MKIDAKAVLKALDAVGDDVRDSLTVVGQKFVDTVEAESIQEQPIDTGNMRGSNFNKVTRAGKKLIFTFGNFADYAFWVHENLTAIHPIGKAQFLIDPILRNAPKFFDDCADAVERAIKRVRK